MKNCVRCPVPGGCGYKPCRLSAYQEAVSSPGGTVMLRWSLMMESRSGPVDRGEPAHVTEAVWRRIAEAYAHLCDRANAWDDSVPVRASLPVEDTLPPAVAERVERVADGYRRLQADVQSAGPPIVHPAGAIPREVEQAITEQIVTVDSWQRKVLDAGCSGEINWLARWKARLFGGDHA